jgi:hypothetical protein
MKKAFLSGILTVSFLTATFLGAQAQQSGATVNKQGASIKNHNGGGVSADKHGAAAKGSSGHGVGVDKHGLDVKGSKGGMGIHKKHFEIKSKHVNVHLGK